MEIINCNDFNGWYAGKFKPTLVNTKDIEFGFKKISKNTRPDYHYHKYKTEYTILIEGLILCESINKRIKPITCIKLLPYEKNDQYFLEESLILIINTPSIQNDKYR